MVRSYRVIFSDDAYRDLDMISEHLVESYMELGDDALSALEKSARRVAKIRKSADKLQRLPNRGTLHSGELQDYRHITFNNAIYWFEVLEAEATVLVLAIFFGGQDHHSRMLRRLS